MLERGQGPQSRALLGPSCAGPAARVHACNSRPSTPPSNPRSPRSAKTQSAAATQGSCDAAALSLALSSTRGSLYGRALTRVLALAGPRGASTAEAAGRGVELRLLSPSRMAPEQRSATVAGLGRASAKEHVAHVGGYRYALKAFAGVVDQPKPQKAGGAGAASKGPAPGPA